MIESKDIDYKSLRKAIGDNARLKDLAETCVCFANAQGGSIVIGIEDKESAPPKNQKIQQAKVNEVVKKLRDLTDGVSIINPTILIHENGGEYFVLKIQPSLRMIATTTSGKVLIRITDNCFHVGSEDLTNLAMEKTAFQWEIIGVQSIHISSVNTGIIKQFIDDIKLSPRVSDFIKDKEDNEILEHYQMIDENQMLTNLGVLWIGTPSQRARLSYPITAQYIVYNEYEEKIRKADWHFHLHNPKQLLIEIEREAVELTYSTELPDGLFRKNIRQYRKEVIRELLINAIAHQKYTMSGDIFIEVYPTKLVISNSGSLPLGITTKNILHQRHRRNPHLIQILSDLGLMEGEGSGYDLVYEKLARDAKPMPVLESEYSKFSVTIYSSIINPDAILILDYIDKHFNLTQKEYITLGIVASDKKVLSTQLAKKLQLNQDDKMRSWVGSLLDKSILITRGIKKGTEYLLNPDLFAQAKLNIKPSLKTIEPYKLEALIIEDLKYNGKSKIAGIKSRISDVDARDIQQMVYKMTDKGLLEKFGAKKNRTYKLSKNK